MKAYDPDDLDGEKSIIDLFRLISYIPVHWQNRFAWLVSFLMLAWIANLKGTTPGQLIEQTSELASLGFSFGATMLGFLIAGFAICVSIMRPDFLLFLHEEKEENTKLTYLKYYLAIFLKSFLIFLTFTFASLVICTIAPYRSELSSIIQAVCEDAEYVKCPLAIVYYAGYGSFFFYQFVTLMVFLFNMYKTFVTAILWEPEEK